MNTVDILMKLDAEKLKEKPKAQLEINRLSKLSGEPFIVELEAVPARRYTDLVAGVVDKNGNIDASKGYKANKMIVLAGMKEPSMKDKALLEYYGCSTPEELLETIFTGGEISAIAEKIIEISGMSGDVVKEVKN